MSLRKYLEPGNHFYFIMLLSCFLTNPLFPQDLKFNLSGTITEKGSGEALIGANVLLFTDSLKISEAVTGAATNRFGYYSIPNLSPGRYYVFASSVGYVTRMEILNVTEAVPSFKLNFALGKAVIEINEVVVTDKKNNFAPTSGTINIDPLLVQKLPSLGGETDIFRALQLLPGVTAATEISTGIYVRGGSADQNLTLIDGVQVYNPSHLGGFASTFNSDAIRNMKLIKGAFPAEYGGRLSSVLDIAMREGSKEKFIGTAGINSISSRVTFEGPVDTNSTFIFSARNMYLDKLLPLIKEFDVLPRYNFYDLNGKINWILSEKDRIFISGFMSRDNISEPLTNKDVGFNILWKNTTVNLTWTNIPSPLFFNSTSLLYTNYRFSTLFQDKDPSKESLDFFTSSIIHDFLLRRETQVYFRETHSIKAGAEIIHHLFNNTTSDFYIKEFGYKTDFGTDISATEASVYLQDDWSYSENLKLNLGSRLNYYFTGNYFVIEPRISATYYLLDRLILRGAFAIANQNLHLLSRHDISLPTDVWYPSNERVKPSQAIQATFGFEATSMDGTFLLSTEGYYKKLSNLYEYKENAAFAYEASVDDNLTNGTGVAYGVEFFLNKRAGKFNGWIGYTLAWTRRDFSDLNTGLQFFPRFDRRHDISIVMTYDLTEKINFGATWTYGTGQAFFLPVGQYQFVGLDNPGNTDRNIFYDYSTRDAFRLPPFHKLDLSCSYHTTIWGADIEVTLNIYNAYNRYNIFTKYIGYTLDEKGEKVIVLKGFTLFPVLPTLGFNFNF